MKIERRKEAYLDPDTGRIKHQDLYVAEEVENAMKNSIRKGGMRKAALCRSPHYKSNRVRRRTTKNSIQTLQNVAEEDSVVELDFGGWEKTPAAESSLMDDLSLFVVEGEDYS